MDTVLAMCRRVPASSSLRALVSTFSCLLILFAAATSWALQPLSSFVEHARTANPSNLQAQATSRQRDAEAAVADTTLWPSFDARGTYTHNQYEILIGLPSANGGPVQNLTVQALNQLDASFKLTVPIIDVGAWNRRAATQLNEDAARANQNATALDVERRVTQAYYQLLGSEALLASALRALEVATDSTESVRNRRLGGVATELDLQRAFAQVASSQQDVESAKFQVVTGRRNLMTLSGLAPTPATAFAADDLHEESPLESYLPDSDDTLPSVASAVAMRKASERSATAAKGAWVPSLSAAVEERLTNATGFSGRNYYYLATVSANWHLDFGIAASVRAKRAAADVARAQELQAKLDAANAIFNAWQQIRADIQKARSARSQVAAANLATELAQDRYDKGVATQLELLQARRDAFQADISRIQADTNLAYSRAALRLNARRTPNPEIR